MSTNYINWSLGRSDHSKEHTGWTLFSMKRSDRKRFGTAG